ncbi:putative Zn-dependent peptidase [Azospirillum lipoferum]|uniref:Insulinase family protein n=1 Tax=Azospirillum lipoferum TaxID=193 RepID=A0A5A9GS10_AZOLI|nr:MULTISPECIES: pitrilysin family protein [Azospirillum]KAA0597143.1 insulinase family protein [Azospirillum lipoferum]MCP1608641.1 putative Zn-dependent peptidase [Azospirillum lipoferum]MDW5536041.1 pitrilysin family protein [Azospirillum sp. NL1]
MSSIRVTTLPNGLRVATDTMPDVQSVSLGCWVGVGTRNEAASVNGVAHLVEHMLFKGTRRRSAFRISEEIENVGGQLNAYTTREQTAYYAKVLHEDAPLALDILSDMIQHSTLDAEELVRERTVVLQEIGQSADTPDDIIFDHFQSTAYPGQAIGRPVLGSAEIVGALPREALVDYIAGHYGAPGMVLSAAGRIEHDRMVDLAFKAFGDLPSGPPPKPEPARYTGGDFREDRDLEQMHLVLGFDGVGVHDPDFYAHSVLSTLLGGGMSSRLFQEVREKRGLVYSIYTFTGGYHDGGLFGVYAGTGEDEVAELVPVVCDEIAKVGADVTEDEVARARAQLKAGTLMALESTMSRCEQLGQQILIYDRPVPVEEIVAKIDGVDRDAVVKAASRLRASRPTVAALGPIAKLESYDRIAERLA